jgi:DNA-directed RNA polymerase specialized sigma24 family protein
MKHPRQAEESAGRSGDPDGGQPVDRDVPRSPAAFRPRDERLQDLADVSLARRAAARRVPAPDTTTVPAHLARILSGDRDGRAWLYDTFSARLYRRLCARYAGRGGLDADELLQDSFLFFFQHDARVLAHFLESVPADERTEARLDGYLWGLACGIASNHRRSTRRRQAVLGPQVEPARDPVDAEKRNVDRDTLVRLTRCLERGGSRVFLYYKLRFVDGLTPEEIARVTGWSRKATYKLKLSLNETVVRCAKRLRIV